MIIGKCQMLMLCHVCAGYFAQLRKLPNRRGYPDATTTHDASLPAVGLAMTCSASSLLSGSGLDALRGISGRFPTILLELSTY